MKLSQLYLLFIFSYVTFFWSCKPKCPVYSCNIRMHHRHGLIMKPKTLEEWGKEMNQKMAGGDSTMTDSTASLTNNEDAGFPTDSTNVEEPKLTKEEKKAKKKQEKEEKKRQKQEEKEAKKKEKEEAKAAKEKEKEEKRIAEGKPPKPPKEEKPKKEKKNKKGEEEAATTPPTAEETPDPNFAVEETPEDKEKKEKEDAAKVVYRSRVMPWWKTKDRKPKVGHKWKKPKNKEKAKLSKEHNKKGKK